MQNSQSFVSLDLYIGLGLDGKCSNSKFKSISLSHSEMLYIIKRCIRIKMYGWACVCVYVYTFLAVKSIFAWSLTFKLSLNDNLFGRSLNLLYSTPSPYIDNSWLILCCCWCIEATHNVSHSIAKQFPCKHQYGDRITEVERRRLVSFKQII